MKEPRTELRHKTPCRECPWRRVAPAGWLGGYTVDDFVNQVQFDGPPLPCHMTIPSGGVMTDAVAMCAGALIFMKNSCKSAQHPDYGDAREQVERDPETVFQWPHEFRQHHANPEGWVVSALAKVRARDMPGKDFPPSPEPRIRNDQP